MRPALVSPSARMRVSILECPVSGTISSPENSASIPSNYTPCFWHLARLPASQSKPSSVSTMLRCYTNVYTKAKQLAGRAEGS